jgi:D-alanine-D-alanine ligase
MKTTRKTVQSYGPVDKPELYVHPEWWKYIFNEWYLKTDADVVEDNTITKYEVDLFLDILTLKKQDAVLDVCCGQGRHCFELASRGYLNVQGIDNSEFLIRKARNRNRLFGYNLIFKTGDARYLPHTVESFDAVTILGNSFGYFQLPADDEKVLQSVYQVLKPGGLLLIDIANGTFLKDKFTPRSWEWINKKYFVCRERSLSDNKQKLISREVITHTGKGVIADQFYSENLYSETELERLLKNAGFKNMCMHNALQIKSQRNQDLGMMENRLIVSAEKPH